MGTDIRKDQKDQQQQQQQQQSPMRDDQTRVRPKDEESDRAKNRGVERDQQQQQQQQRGEPGRGQNETTRDPTRNPDPEVGRDQQG
jgi:hypothetical protein